MTSEISRALLDCLGDIDKKFLKCPLDYSGNPIKPGMTMRSTKSTDLIYVVAVSSEYVIGTKTIDGKLKKFVPIEMVRWYG